MFEELEIDALEINNDLYVNVKQLFDHIIKATDSFKSETEAIAKLVGTTPQEKYFCMGIVQGMYNIAVMLKHGRDESSFESVETVEDMVKKFWSD
jgi:hypothetical protein